MNTTGAELSITTQPIQKLKIEVSSTYQVTQDHSEGMENLNLEAAYAPKFLGYTKLSYSITDNISIGVKEKFVDAMETEYNFEKDVRYGVRVPSYFTLDANVRAQIWKGLFINVLGSNLTNTEVRYPNTQNTTWMDQGMLGYGMRLTGTIGYKF